MVLWVVFAYGVPSRGLTPVYHKNPVITMETTTKTYSHYLWFNRLCDIISIQSRLEIQKGMTLNNPIFTPQVTRDLLNDNQLTLLSVQATVYQIIRKKGLS